MKKIWLIILLLLGVAGAIAGYYLLYLPAENAKMASAKPREPVPETATQVIQAPSSDAAKPEVTVYYVKQQKTGVRHYPKDDTYIDHYLYRGDKVVTLEKKQGWGRISEYWVEEKDGPQQAEWVPITELSETPPVITPEEQRQTLLGYIAKSDDLLTYQTSFLKATSSLLSSGACKPDDFDELGGWVKSVKFPDKDIYFIYCGGLKQKNKIYLNARTGEVILH